MIVKYAQKTQNTILETRVSRTVEMIEKNPRLLANFCKIWHMLGRENLDYWMTDKRWQGSFGRAKWAWVTYKNNLNNLLLY